MPKIIPILVAGLCALLSTGCDSADPGGDVSPRETGTYVAAQGNFGDANGSVTYYNPTTRETQTILQGIGSTVQSLFIHEHSLYVLANSADRIEVLPLQGGAQGSITDVLSPRYMALVDDSIAYVTGLFGSPEVFTGGRVTVVNLAARSVMTTIPVGDNPEGIAIVDSLAFVANSGFGFGRTVSVIDTRTHAVIDEVDVDCDGPRIVLADDERDVWVVCTGQEIYDGGELVERTNGAVRVLHPQTFAIRDRIDLDGPVMTLGQDAAVAGGIGQLFVVVGVDRIARFDTRSHDHIGVIGPLPGEPISAVAFDGVNERIYVGRTPSFTEAGRVTIHNLQGQEVDSFAAGVAPTHVVFRYE